MTDNAQEMAEIGAKHSARLSINYETGMGSHAQILHDTRIYCFGRYLPDSEARARIVLDNDKRPMELVELMGRDTAPVQFTIRHDGKQWRINRYGTTPVWLDGEELFDGSARGVPVDSDGLIRITNASITMKELRTGAVDSGALLESTEWRKTQDLINIRLVNEYGDVIGSDSAERILDTDAVREDPRFMALLSRIATSMLADLPETALQSAVTWAVRKDLTARVAPSKMMDDTLHVVPIQFHAQQIIGLSDRMSDALELSFSKDAVDSDLDCIAGKLSSVSANDIATVSRGDKLEITRAFLCANIWDFVFNYGPITDLMRNLSVSEIMVVSYDRIYIERGGQIERYGYAFSDERQLRVLLERVVGASGRELSESSPMVDFRFSDGSRVNVIGPPLTLKGPCVTIRKHAAGGAFTLDSLSEQGSVSQSMAWFLQSCVRARKNIVVSGGTGTGKTTLLNALSDFIPSNQRVVTIEDTAELKLANDHVVSLQSKPATTEGRSEVTIRHLVKNALRMRPDRIIVGECRGGEAVDMLQALNTGHEGSMTTGHANSCDDMLMRLEVMVLQGEPNLPVTAIRRQIVSAIDIIVQITRTEGKRRVVDISEVIDVDDRTGEIVVEPVFRYVPPKSLGSEGRHIFTGMVPSFVEEVFLNRPIRGGGDNMEAPQNPVEIHEVFV